MKIKLLFIALGAVILVGLGAWGFNMQKGADNGVGFERPVACTQEAKICPDGSAVGRTGPSCEFAPCPVINTPPSPPTPIKKIAAGYAAGYVTIGPNCPVERVDQPCPTPPEAYTSREAVIYASDSVTIVARTHLDTNGNYKITLGPGKYFAQIQPAGIGPGEKKPFTVVSFETTTLDFDVDTGIR